jgi:hypothetical protein
MDWVRPVCVEGHENGLADSPEERQQRRRKVARPGSGSHLLHLCGGEREIGHGHCLHYLEEGALAKNPIPPKMGLDWTCTKLLLWILTVYLRINSQPSLIESISVQIHLGALTNTPIKR